MAKTSTSKSERSSLNTTKSKSSRKKLMVILVIKKINPRRDKASIVIASIRCARRCLSQKGKPTKRKEGRKKEEIQVQIPKDRAEVPGAGVEAEVDLLI